MASEIKVTNIKANDGTASLTVSDNSGNVTLAGNATMSGTLGVTGVTTFTARDIHNAGITIADAGNIGSASDLDAIAIAANGNVTVSQNLAVSGTVTITGSQSRLVGISWCNANCDGNAVTLENSKTYDAVAVSIGSAGSKLTYSHFSVDGSGSVTQTQKVTASTSWHFYWSVGTNTIWVNEAVANQGPHWSLVFERGATFDNG